LCKVLHCNGLDTKYLLSKRYGPSANRRGHFAFLIYFYFTELDKTKMPSLGKIFFER
jgi:hypothetical protein